MKDIIKWCLNKKDGIRIVEPNENLSDAYIKEADETLDVMLSTEGKWKIIIAYYACYNSLYSILIKAGIKSEIHSCTIALMELMGFDKSDIEFMENLKEDRTNVQYYLKSKQLEDENQVKEFIIKCKELRDKIDVDTIRKKLGFMKNGKK